MKTCPIFFGAERVDTYNEQTFINISSRLLPVWPLVKPNTASIRYMVNDWIERSIMILMDKT